VVFVGSRVRLAFLSVCLVFAAGEAAAQNPDQIINLFGGLMRSGVAVATQAAWQKIPPDEIACVDQQLRQRGSSINAVVQQGVGPADARLFDVRSACRGQSAQQASRSGPSFDCSKSSFADEFTICSNPELSQLDVQIAAAYAYVRDHLGEQVARATRDRSLRARHGCGSDQACIRQVQITAINDYQRLGAPSAGSADVASSHPEYVVDGLALGGRVAFESAVNRDYKCRPSDQFYGFVFCQRQRTMQERRGAYTSSNSILHAADGTAVYLNRYLEPAFFDGDEAKADVAGRSKKFGPPTQVISMPTNADVPNGMIVSWGEVVLEPVDPATMKALASGNGVRVGFLIDHIGNLRRSASLGLPVYRMGGGPGYVWAASWNDSGIGTLQFLTIDASRFTPPMTSSTNTPPQAPASAPTTADSLPNAPQPAANATSSPSSPASAVKVADTPSAARLARQRIRENLDRITSQRNNLPNDAFRTKLDLIASKLATANEQTDADTLTSLLRECDAEDSVFREAGEFRQVADIAKRLVAIVRSKLETINFDAPLVHDIKAVLISVDSALTGESLNSLKQALSELNNIYDPNKLDRLAEAKAHGFDTAESYEEFKDRQSKLSRSGIRLNEK
jgi:hypothetical protein